MISFRFENKREKQGGGVYYRSERAKRRGKEREREKQLVIDCTNIHLIHERSKEEKKKSRLKAKCIFTRITMVEK